MTNEAFPVLNENEFLIKDSGPEIKSLKKKLNIGFPLAKAIVILNIEDSDYTDKYKQIGKYLFGNKLIFVNNRFMSEANNLHYLGFIFPNFIITEPIRGWHAMDSYFASENLNREITTLVELDPAHSLLLPIKKMNFASSKLSYTGSVVTKRRYRYRNDRDNSVNNIIMNDYNFIIKAICLNGIIINKNSIHNIKEIFNPDLPQNGVMFKLFENIFLASNKRQSMNPYNRQGLNRINSQKRFEQREIDHWIMKKRPYWYSRDYSNLNIFDIMWVLQHELSLIDISDELEVVDE